MKSAERSAIWLGHSAKYKSFIFKLEHLLRSFDFRNGISKLLQSKKHVELHRY